MNEKFQNQIISQVNEEVFAVFRKYKFGLIDIITFLSGILIAAYDSAYQSVNMKVDPQLEKLLKEKAIEVTKLHNELIKFDKELNKQNN